MEGGHWQDHHQPAEQAMLKHQTGPGGESWGRGEEMLDHGQGCGGPAAEHGSRQAGGSSLAPAQQ